MTLKTLPLPTVLMHSQSPWVLSLVPVPSRLSSSPRQVLQVRNLLFAIAILSNTFIEGGKTGITAVVTGLLFFVSIFFAPIFASIPPWATGGALVIVGSLMIRNVRDINWDYIGDALPAFLTILIIPLSFKYVLVESMRCMTEALQHCVRCHCRRCDLYPSQRYCLGRAQSDRRPYFTPQLGCIGSMGRPPWWYHSPVAVSLRYACTFRFLLSSVAASTCSTVGASR